MDGNGQTELVETITGLRAATGGRVRVLNQDATNRSPRDILAMGVSYIPADRQHIGLLLDFSVAENLIGKEFCSPPFARRGFLQQEVIARFVGDCVRLFDIRTPTSQLKARLLSGGNQQKTVLARELSRRPDLLVAAQPTRGLDVGATEYVRQQMIAARGEGAAILLISTELEEILSLSDRIAVMYEGEIIGILPADQADVHEIGLMMAGVRPGQGDQPQPEEVA